MPPAPDRARYGFLLLPDYALMSTASAVEPLRAANLLGGRDRKSTRLNSSHQ